MFNRNLFVLFLAQMISVSVSVTMVQLGGILGSTLSSREDMATLPLSAMVVGTALASIPAALIMRSIGRRCGFALASIIGMAGTLLAALALYQQNFLLFCLAAISVGFNLAFVQQFRFAAAESVASEKVSQAVSLVLLGSIGGAFLGPRLIQFISERFPGSFVAVFVTLACMLLFSAILIATSYRDVNINVPDEVPARRSLPTIFQDPGFALAVFGGLVAYGIMTLVMTATPISMHVVQGHSMNHTGWVITSHVLAMYVPSLFSGVLIARFGSRAMMVAGALLLGAALAFGLAGKAVHDYWLALVALGIGWNFLYVGATTLLVQSYRNEERFKAQAINDFSVFGSAALASLLSGVVLHSLGWNLLLWLPVPLLLLLLVGLYRNVSRAQSAALS